MMCEDAITKISLEMDKIENSQIPVEPIVDYLLTQCVDDTEFPNVVMKEDKTLKGCIDYIMKEAKKILNGKSGCLEDSKVFEIAKNYFFAPPEPKKERPTCDNKVKTTAKTKTDKQVSLEDLLASNNEVIDKDKEKEKAQEDSKVVDIKDTNIQKEDKKEPIKNEVVEEPKAKENNNVVHFEEKKNQKMKNKMLVNNSNIEGQVSMFDLL
ncbi:Cas9 inhibitor AcrIIA9 family protein [Clostridium sp.]|uniref:Cas9 inhibitor AcrIIA9 family protein n=1 Tax=Clostridium sp. TaxID=1506 RepID=UPI001B556DD2|nr:Cas9 inhibitor AcrIIA9 family protein [Clostridium sp.]MBP3916031.1 hypothetical protein [Clostridium sp.]